MTFEQSQDLNVFNELINEDPKHKELSEDGLYELVPISFLEPDLRFVYKGLIKTSIKSITEMFDGIIMVATLSVFHPVIEEWMSFDGTSGLTINSISDSEYKGASKVSRIIDLKTATPILYSECIKVAAKKIGRRFGQDLNRQKNNAKMTQKEITAKKKKTADERVLHLIEDCDTIADLNAIMKELPNTESVQEALNAKLKDLKKKKND